MQNIFLKIKDIFFNKKFVGFCLIGFINTFNTAFFSWLAHLKVQQNIAAIFGYIISLTINYILNSKLVFKKRLKFKRYARYLISYIPNFIIYFMVSFITINTLNIDQFWATIIAAIMGAPLTFAVIMLYAFKKSKK